MTSFNEVEDIIAFFRQKQAKYSDKMDFDGNITYLKFDMRDIINIIPPNHIKPLINFYLKNSSRKTLKDFTQTYDEYYKALINYAEDRKHRMAVARQTMERVSEQRS